MPYQVVKAKNEREALEKSDWKEGSLAVCKSVVAASNNDGTYTLLTEFDRVEGFMRPIVGGKGK